MTPEKDVKNNAGDELPGDAHDHDAVTGNAPEASDFSAQHSGDSDLHAAEDAQSRADGEDDNLQPGESVSDSAGEPDDPLGFGDERMPGNADDDVAALREQLEAAEGKAATHWDQLLRLQAEMENQRKRAQNDIDKARKFGLENFANDLLPVKDSLEMGLAAAEADASDAGKIIEGTELTLKMLVQVFEKYNIVEINPIGEKFDPEFHQAMSMQPAEGKEPNTVSGVMQKGYTLNDRLIRPALVMVVK